MKYWFSVYLGQDPQRSMSLFVKGLGLFAFGLLFIAIGYYHHFYWQIPGLVFLSIGVVAAIFGYLGLFIYRMKNLVGKHKPKSSNNH